MTFRHLLPAHGLGQSLRIPNWHDTGSTSPRSVGEVALIWDTISHYSRVLIAPLAIAYRVDRTKKKRAAGVVGSGGSP
jgi:hypothetical protein